MYFKVFKIYIDLINKPNPCIFPVISYFPYTYNTDIVNRIKGYGPFAAFTDYNEKEVIENNKWILLDSFSVVEYMI